MKRKRNNKLNIFLIIISMQEIALTSDLISKAVTQAIVYAKGGHRVLAVAQTLLPADAFPEDYEFDLGLINFPCVSFFLITLAFFLILEFSP